MLEKLREMLRIIYPKHDYTIQPIGAKEAKVVHKRSKRWQIIRYNGYYYNELSKEDGDNAE